MDISSTSPGHCSPSKKVCFVYSTPGLPWSVYCVNLESEASSFLVPKVRLHDLSFDYAAFCVLESTLYVFEGFTSETLDSKFIYSYKLEAEVSDFKLEKHMMERVCSMTYLKYFPMALPTPDGKGIILCSREVGPDFLYRFEFFNLKTRKCQELPELRYDEDFSHILSHAFLSEHVLLLKIEEESGGRRSYILDFQDSLTPPPWKESFRFSRAPLEDDSVILGNDVCLTPTAGYNIDLGCQEEADVFSRWRYLFPEISSLPDGRVTERCFLTLIAGEDENGVCEFCILHAGTEEDVKEGEWKYIRHIVLDVYRCDLNVCREDMKRLKELKMVCGAFPLPGAKKIKSLRFSIEPGDTDCFDFLAFSTY